MDTAIGQAWRKRIVNQRGSGQSIRAWCKSNNCQEHAFYWWRTRLGLSPTSVPRDSQAAPIKFAEVVAEVKSVAPPDVAEPMMLRLKGGHELVLPTSMSVEQVAKLIRAIEAPAPGPGPGGTA